MSDETATEETTEKTEDKGKEKAKPRIPSLLPNAKTYIENDQNVLLIGLHGTGKTETVRALAEEMGLKVKSYSCSTLDPYTDLVGVPVPKQTEDGRDYLKQIRPLDIDEADIVFFDELNRARPEIQDAVLEIINNKTINGEPLPKLKCCWAAINPPDGDYKVDELDPALMDRFDAYIEFTPRPSVAYMAQYMPKKVAKALKAWYDDHNKNKRKEYISPRRLHKIGVIFMTHQNKRAVLAAMPPGIKSDTNKLYRMLEDAIEPEDDSGGGIGDGAAKFAYNDHDKLLKQAPKVAKYLKENPENLETHRKVAKSLKTRIGGGKLVEEWADVLEALNKPILESLISGYPQPKQSQMRSTYADIMQDTGGTSWARKHKNLHGVLKDTAKNALSAGTLPDIP